MKTEAGWATAVRILALTAIVSATVAALEAKSIRSLRAELQTLRTEREAAKAGVSAAWAAQSIGELNQAIRWMDNFYADSTEGFGRPGGLCAAGRLNDEALARFTIGAFLPARAARQPVSDSIEAMKTAIRRTDEYRTIHPDLALPAQ
jgi:hypothetical protein